MNPFEHMQLPLGWTTAAVGSVGTVRYGLGQPPELDDNGVAMVTKPWVDSVAGYDLVLSLDDNFDPSYCAFALRSAEVQNYFKSQSARSAQPSILPPQMASNTG